MLRTPFDVHETTSTTIRRIRARALANFHDPEIRAFRASAQKKKCGQEKKWNHDEVREEAKEIPLNQKKRSLRGLASSVAGNAIDSCASDEQEW